VAAWAAATSTTDRRRAFRILRIAGESGGAALLSPFSWTIALVELHVLQAFDALIWLRSAAAVECRYGISEATISRYRKRCLALFHLALERRQGEWELLGDTSILLLERAVHQEARWRGAAPLRLEATYWSAPLLQSPPLRDWLLGVSNIVGVRRTFQLVQDRIVDALITGLPDLPTDRQPALCAIPIVRMPVAYLVAPGHPLLRRGSLTVADIAEFPSLALPEGSYPLVEEALRRLGLWNDGVRMARYRRDLWEGRAEQELVVGYGTALSLAVSGERLCRLPLELPFASGDALVVRREYADHPRLHDLLLDLHRRYAPMVRRFADVTFDPLFLRRLGA
jgi:hypothetical protein